LHQKSSLWVVVVGREWLHDVNLERYDWEIRVSSRVFSLLEAQSIGASGNACEYVYAYCERDFFKVKEVETLWAETDASNIC
jgi:hypothetical protein